MERKTSIASLLLYALLYNVVLLTCVGLSLLTPFPESVAAALVGFLLGAALGSCLHQIGFRILHGVSLRADSSFCPHCRADIPRRYNIPILSWLLLRGRCFRCKASIPWHYVAVEVAVAVACAGLGILLAVVW